jgi:serine/threonine protein kinase
MDDQNTVAPLEDQKTVSSLSDQETVASLDDGDTVVSSDDQKTVASLKHQQTLTSLDDRQTVPSVDDESQTEQNPFELGRVLDGKYKIVELLGKGGMGAVYRVTQVLLNVDVALKTLDHQRLNDFASVRRFQTEARAAFSLKHPSLISVYDFGVLESNHPFIVMELIDGTTLQDYMKQRGPLPLEEVAPIFAQLCFGLAYAHQSKVVHRDIKPGNIMLCAGKQPTEEGSVKILDFGIAKIVRTADSATESLTQTGDVIGSPLYMSPEQCAGGDIDHRSDIYSLGCVLFEALTGTPPHVGANSLRTMMLHQSVIAPTLKEAALGRDFPSSLEQIVAKLLAKAPNDRYGDLGAVAFDLSEACAGKGPKSSQLANIATAAKLASKATASLTLSWLSFFLILLVSVGISTFAGYQLALRATPRVAKSEKPSAPKGRVERESTEVASTNLASSADDTLRQKANSIQGSAKTSFEKALPITETTEVRDGQEKGMINFPDQPIGSVTYTTPDVSGKPQRFEDTAVGPVYVPLATPLAYNLSAAKAPDVLPNAFVFDKIGKNIFETLAFRGSVKGQSLQVLEDKSVDASDEAAGTLQLLNSASKWTKLKQVSLSNTIVTNEMLDALDQMKALKVFIIRRCDLKKKVVFRKSLVSKLEIITMRELTTADQILGQIANSKNLRTIEIGYDCPISKSTVLNLTSCPNLTVALLAMTKIDNETIQAILKSKSLKMLALKIKSVNDAQIKELLAAGWTVTNGNALKAKAVEDITFARLH